MNGGIISTLLLISHNDSPPMLPGGVVGRAATTTWTGFYFPGSIHVTKSIKAGIIKLIETAPG